MLGQAFDAVSTHTIDGRIASWNRAAESLFGFAAVEAVGSKSHEPLHTFFPNGHDVCNAELDEHRSWDGELLQTCKLETAPDAMEPAPTGAA